MQEKKKTDSKTTWRISL